MTDSVFQNKQKILLVHQKADMMQLFRQLFESEYQLLTDNKGEAIQQLAAKKQPDLIILDTGIPHLNALEECFFLKSDPATKAIPVLLMSKGAAKDLQLGFHVGAADYIFTPFNNDLLKARIKSHLALRKASYLLHNHHQRHEVTHLPDEAYFEDELEKEWFHNVRCHQNISLILLEIDSFKHFKNIYGAAVVETAQLSIARLLQVQCHRSKDFIAQLSESRFGILVTAEKHDQLRLFAESLRAAVATTEFHHLGNQKPFRLTVSISLVTVGPDLTMKSAMRYFVQAGEKYLQQAIYHGDRVCDQLLSNLQLVIETAVVKVQGSTLFSRPLR